MILPKHLETDFATVSNEELGAAEKIYDQAIIRSYFDNESKLTLNQILNKLGYTTKPGKFYRKKIFDIDNNLVGEFSAHECTEYLKEKYL